MNKYSLLFALSFAYIATATAQDFMMQGWYWNYPTTVGSKKWVSYMDTKLPEISDAGFTYVWLPPLSHGSDNASIGYDVQDYYDLGQFRSTRWGLRTHLNQFIADGNALGVKVVADIVYNHRNQG